MTPELSAESVVFEVSWTPLPTWTSAIVESFRHRLIRHLEFEAMNYCSVVEVRQIDGADA